MATPKAQYKYIRSRGGGDSEKFDVRFRDPENWKKTVSKTFDKEQLAVNFVLKHFPEETPATLRRSEKSKEAKHPGQTYKHVRWHKVHQKWLVQLECLDDEVHYFDDEEEAAAFAADSLHTTTAALELAETTVHYGSAEDLKAQAADLLEIMQGALPADAENFEEYANPNSGPTSTILKEVPGLIPAFCLAKHSHDRAVLEETWNRWARKKISAPAHVPGADLCAYQLYCVLLEVARLLSGSRWSVQWREHVGRGCDHYQRFCFYLHRMSMLAYKAPEGVEEGFTYHATNKKHFPVPYNKLIQDRLLLTIKFGVKLQQAPAPDNVRDWGIVVRDLDRNTGEVPGCAGKGDYMKLWVMRAYLVYRMRQRKIMNLKPGDATMESMLLAFPDQKDQLMLYASLPGVHKKMRRRVKVVDMVKAMRYTGGLEYLSMWGCVTADNKLRKTLQKKPRGWLKENRARLIQVRTKFRQKHGHNPHVACVVLNKFL